MAASNEIRFKIGADTSALSRGFTTAQTLATQAGTAMEKRFTGKKLFGSVFAALGFDITRISDTIARAFTGMSEEAERSLNAIVAATERARSAIEGQFSRRRTPEQNAERNVKEQARLQRELAEINQMTPMNDFERHATAAGLGLGEIQSRILEEKGVQTWKFIERAAEIQARLQELAGELEQLDPAKTDRARGLGNSTFKLGAAFDRARGAPNNTDAEKLLELERQRAEIVSELNAQGTSPARKEQLTQQSTELLTKQFEIQARWREATRAVAEKIQQIERETAALGETKGEAILRLKREAFEIDRRAHDLSRSDDERRGLRVQAAERMAAATKSEFDLKVGSANIGASLKNPSGTRNTTTQGILAGRATNYRERAEAARAQGKFGEAARLGGLATAAEEKFSINDRKGMIAATGVRLNATSATDRLMKGEPKKNELAQLSPESKQLVGIKKTLDEINKSLKPTTLKK